MNTDDLLSFKEFEPVHDSYARGASRAEININSPKKSAFDENLHNLVNDMSTSVQILSNEVEDGNMDRGNCKLFEREMSTYNICAFSCWHRR